MKTDYSVYLETFRTAFGEFTVAVNEAGALAAAGFGRKTLLPKEAKAVTDPARTRVAKRQIEEFLAGERQSFSLEIDAQGTAFQKRVWSELRKIPFGRNRSYGDLAKTLKRPRGARAVGQAVGSNPFCIVVPCHRVIASDGSLGGYAFGAGLKRKLLNLEGTPYK